MTCKVYATIQASSRLHHETHEEISLLPTPINLFETTLIDNKHEKSESYSGGACLPPKQNAVTAERVPLQSKYAVQRSVSHSKVKDDGVQLYNKTHNKNKYAPRITHIA